MARQLRDDFNIHVASYVISKNVSTALDLMLGLRAIIYMCSRRCIFDDNIIQIA
jgi:hypothetical protein